jgi:hypothetical protein
MMRAHEAWNPFMISPGRQLLLGVGLLAVGAAWAVLLIEAGLNVAGAPGFVLVIWGLVLIGNGLLAQHRERDRDA